MLRLLLVILLFTANCSWAQYKNIEYPRAGAPLGIGWNSALGVQADAFCVEFTLGHEPAQVRATDAQSFSLSDKLNKVTKVSGEFKASAIKGVAASAKAEFVNSYRFSLEDKSFYAFARVQNEPEVTEPSREMPLGLSARYLEMLSTPEGVAQFYRECGDAFVQRRYGGVELVALVTLRDIEEESKNDISLSFSADGVVFSLSGAYSSAESRTRIENTTRFTYTLIGGQGTAGAVDRAGLNEIIKNLASSAINAPKFWEIELRRYDTLSNWPRNIVQPRSQNRLALAADMHNRLLQIFSVATNGLTNPDQYIWKSVFPGDLAEIQELTRQELGKLKTAIDACLSEAQDCGALPSEDKFDYYYAYSRLPLRRGANAYDRAIIATETKKIGLGMGLQAVLDNVGRIFRGPAPTCEMLMTPVQQRGGGAGVPQAPPPRELVDAIERCTALSATNVELNKLRGSEESAAIKKTVIQKWIRDISAEYCSVDSQHPLCLRADKLAQYESEISKRVYGLCITRAYLQLQKPYFIEADSGSKEDRCMYTDSPNIGY